MKLEIKCTTCDKTLVVIDKEVISQEDINMYTNSVSCDEHGNADIQAVEEVVVG